MFKLTIKFYDDANSKIKPVTFDVDGIRVSMCDGLEYAMGNQSSGYPLYGIDSFSLTQGTNEKGVALFFDAVAYVSVGIPICVRGCPSAPVGGEVCDLCGIDEPPEDKDKDRYCVVKVPLHIHKIEGSSDGIRIPTYYGQHSVEAVFDSITVGSYSV